MRTDRRPGEAQRGAALIGLLVIVLLGFAYLLVSRLHPASGFVAIDRNRNAEVLNLAKRALIGYVAQQAATAGEDNPGRLPCPEAGAFFGTANEGKASSFCSLPAVGRLPWRTLGIDKPVDSDNEALWYVVSPGWALPNSSTDTLINSNSIGQLTVDGAANRAVALIIAPGAPTTATTGAGCGTGVQSRATTGTPSKCNYLEAENALGATFVTSSTAFPFNDQVVLVTAAEVLPEIEAAIAARIEREIVPLLKSVYASSAWGTNLSAANPAYPFPAPFADPSATASYRGNGSTCAASGCQGLLPVNFSNDGTGGPCTQAAGSPCDPNFVAWTGTPPPTVTQTGGLTLASSSCSVGTVAVAAPLGQTSQVSCDLVAWSLLGFGGTMNIRLQATASNVGMAMRTFNTAPALSGATLTAPTPTATLNSDGSATMTLNAQVNVGSGGLVSNLLCGISGLLSLFFDCRTVTVTLPMASNTPGSSVFPDHPLLDATNATTGWFMRNEWYRVLYYGVAQNDTPAGLPAAPACTPGTNCLVVNNLSPANNKRAVLLLAGRSLQGTVGANRLLTDFLDTAENRSSNGVFEKLPAGAVSNDRLVVVDSN